VSALDDLVNTAAISVRRAPGDVAKLEAAALRYAADRVRATGELLTTELGPKRMAEFLEDLVAESAVRCCERDHDGDGDGDCDRHPARREALLTRQLDRLAAGPNPRSRVPVPKRGERCPRCHSGAQDRACLLCRPDLVPASAVAACPGCQRPVDACCVSIFGGDLSGGYDHLARRHAAARILAQYDAEATGAGYLRTNLGGGVDYIPAEQITVLPGPPRP
jgi:hypothetical protein